jgi:hypothetical protein
MNDTTPSLPPYYCRVCWAPVYRLWADGIPPDNACYHGCKAAHECPDAMGRAMATGEALKIIAEEKARKAVL